MEEVERVHFAGWQRSLSLEWRDWERKMEEWKRNQTRSRKKGEDSAEAIEFDQSTPEPDTPKYVKKIIMCTHHIIPCIHTFIAVHTPVYTRYTCIYNHIYT